MIYILQCPSPVLSIREYSKKLVRWLIAGKRFYSAFLIVLCKWVNETFIFFFLQLILHYVISVGNTDVSGFTNNVLIYRSWISSTLKHKVLRFIWRKVRKKVSSCIFTTTTKVKQTKNDFSNLIREMCINSFTFIDQFGNNLYWNVWDFLYVTCKIWLLFIDAWSLASAKIEFLYDFSVITRPSLGYFIAFTLLKLQWNHGRI